MFFIVGGITPKIKRISEFARNCPNCSKVSLYHVRLDHYLNLFFIPLFPVKKGQPFYQCRNCGREFLEWSHPSPNSYQSSQAPSSQVCPGCGRPVEKGFRYCPHCGRTLN